MNHSYVLLAETLGQLAIQVEAPDEAMINDGKILCMPYDGGELYMWLSVTGQINTLDTGTGWPMVLSNFAELMEQLEEE